MNPTPILHAAMLLTDSDLHRDQEIDCMAETEEGKDGTTDLRAVRIRLKTPR